MINEKELIKKLDRSKGDTVSKENLKWLLQSMALDGKIIYHSVDTLEKYISESEINFLSEKREKDCYLLAKELLTIKQKLKDIAKDNIFLTEDQFYFKPNKIDEIHSSIIDLIMKHG